jgi:hypothetical protein
MDTGPVLPFSPYPEIQFQDATCDAEIALETTIVASEKQIQSSVHDLNTYPLEKEGRKEGRKQR